MTSKTSSPESGTLIVDSDELAAACAQFRGEPYVTVDTEFMRESSYWPKLCLVQIAGAELAAVVDPLAPGIDLTPLYDLLADQNVLKVFHAGRQDMEIFFYAMGKLPAPVFDTQIAAMVCGFGDSVAYETLVAKLAQARIDKSSRFTDWSARPLRKRQIDYAVGDVTHLRKAYEALSELLEENGRAAWLGEENAALTAAETYATDPRQAFQRIKTRSSSPRVLAILRELAAWREEEAQKRDIPRNRLLRDEALLEIAHHHPGNVEELGRTRGMGRRQAEGEQGQKILAAIARGQALPESECPQPAESRDRMRERGPLADLLKVLLKARCANAGVAQKLVASSDDVEVLAAQGENADVPALRGWRREVYGQYALSLRRGDIALAARNGRLVTISAEKSPSAE